jgi:hypothetical protein
MIKNPAHGTGVVDEGNAAHFGVTKRAGQRQDCIDARQQQRTIRGQSKILGGCEAGWTGDCNGSDKHSRVNWQVNLSSKECLL